MRLDSQHIAAIKRLAAEQFGARVRVRLFGSRVDDAAHGGDVDLLVELDTQLDQPALVVSGLSNSFSRLMEGRRVDVVMLAPNLMRLPSHDVVLRDGVLQ